MSRTKDALIDVMNDQRETIPCYNNCAFYFEWDVGECLLEHNDILDVKFYDFVDNFIDGVRPTSCPYYRTVDWLRNTLIDIGK